MSGACSSEDIYYDCELFFLFLLLPILTDTTVIHGGIVSRTRTAVSEDADCRQQAAKQG